MKSPASALAVIVVTGLIIAACSTSTTEPPIVVQDVHIAVVASQTGAQTDLGTSIIRGAQLAADAITASGQLTRWRIVLHILNDESRVNGAQAAFHFAVDSLHASAIIGPTTSTFAFAADSIAAAAHVSVLAVSNSAEGITAMGPYVFRVGLPESVIIPHLITTTHTALNYARCAIVYTADDAYSVDAMHLFETALLGAGVAIPVKAPVSLTTLDFEQEIAVIKAANVQAIIISTQLTEGAIFMRQARLAGIPASVPFIVSSGIGGTNVASKAGAAAEGLISGSGWLDKLTTPGNAQFIAAFTAVHGEAPTSTAAQSYAAVAIIANALASRTSTDMPLRDAIERTSGLPTILGPITYSASSHEPGYPPVVKIMRNWVWELF